MVRFRTQVMFVTTALVIAACLALGGVLISLSAHMAYNQLRGTGRAVTRLLAAQLEQKHEMMTHLIRERRGPMLPGRGRRIEQPPESAPPPDEGDRESRPGFRLEADLLELGQIIGASRIGIVADGKPAVNVVPPNAPPDDLDDDEVMALWQQLKDTPAGEVAVSETRTSIACMTLVNASLPTGEKPGMLLTLPKTLPRQIVVARAAVLVSVVLSVVAAAVLAAWLISRVISRPLSQLAATARAYGQGNLDTPAPVEGPAETRHLGTALNSMAASLKDHIRYLDEETTRREQLESELRVAADLQRSLLPSPGLQRFGAVQVLGWSKAAKAVGGDFYDFRSVGLDRFAVVIGDATGKGITAALLAAKCVSVLQALVEEIDDPADLLCRVNTLVSEQFKRDGHFVTAFLGIVDLTGGRFSYSRAGHNPPLLAKADGNGPVALDDQQGLPLAVAPRSDFQCTTLATGAGETLLLYTDGVTEAVDATGCLYGEDRLTGVFAAHAHDALPDLLDALTSDVHTHCGQCPPRDDCTLLLVRIG